MTFSPLPHRLFRSTALAVVLTLSAAGCASAGAEGEAPAPRTAATKSGEGRVLDLRAWGLGKVREAAPLTPGPAAAGKYLAARQAQRESDTRAAADYFEQALKGDPDNPTLLRRAFFYMIAEGRVEDAVPLARRTLELEPDSGVAPLVLAVSAMADGRARAAEETIARTDPRGLNSFMAPLVRAWTLAAQDRPADALAALEPLAQQPQFLDLHALHAALIADLGGLEAEAATHYEALLDDAPDLSLRAMQAGISWLRRTGQEDRATNLIDAYNAQMASSGLLNAAVEDMRAGAAAEPIVGTAREGMAEAFYGAASTLTQGNALDTGLVFARLAEHLDPDLDLSDLLIGDVLTRMDRLEEANRAYALVEPGEIGWYTARLRMADNRERMGDLDGAEALLEQVAKTHPDRAEPLVVLGDILRRNERWDRATEAYDRALERAGEIGPEHWAWLYSRGITHERAGRWEQAEDDFLKALELEPGQPFVLNYLGYSWIDRGENLERGREMIEEAVAQRPRDGYIVDSLGWVYYLLGNYTDAVRHLERAVELSPNDPTINDHLGDAYWRVGRRNEARFQWRRALDMGPTEPGQAEELERKIAEGMEPRDPADVPGQ
ncbi:tetratricopeptide repeat protein [Caenispirillum salinarum]|uniref:tetratricopeptide repeat protein n=1 Tax=Caenispirillum salinarum TaxID=859058 RepID=UPI00384A6593